MEEPIYFFDENHPYFDLFHDRYWGRGPDGSGENRAGVLLMEVREELRRAGDLATQEPPSSESPPPS